MKSSAFRALTTTPLNGAPSPDALVRARITDAADFFVRNHGDVPAPRAASVRVDGLVRRAFDASLAAFPRVSVEATLQCAGNRRSALQHVRPIPNEVPWSNEAIGNAVWDGVPLSSVLEEAGVLEGAAHVWFVGAEQLSGKHAGEQFGASIPLAKALSGNVLLADSMNGTPLPPAHGAPIRAIVPGFIGARSVKWLREIRVEREPSPNYFQRAYSVFPASMLSVPVDHAGGTVLGELALNSAFAVPSDDARVAAGKSTVRGWAMAGGDRRVARVEVSCDGGETWTAARFASTPQRFVWCLWAADVELAAGNHELICRAIDDAGATQPTEAAEVWNVKGYANNAWHRIRVRAE